jgi:gliding motility-associated-like protein
MTGISENHTTIGPAFSRIPPSPLEAQKRRCRNIPVCRQGRSGKTVWVFSDVLKFKSLFFLAFLFPVLLQAQYLSDAGRFQVQEKKGCAALDLEVENLLAGECEPGKPCVMEWGDGTANQTNAFQHTYSQPGTYLLKVLYQTIGYDQIEITVTPNIQPAFDIYTCGNREVQVKVTDTNYDSYIINYNDGSGEVTVTSNVVTNYTYVTTGLKSISVRGKNLNAADNCMPARTKPVTAVTGLTAPVIDLLTVSSSNQINLDFNNLDNVLYRLDMAVNSATNFQFVKPVHDVSSTSQANLLTDNNYYCFRLGATDPCNGTPPLYSNIICSANFDATPQNNVINLNWSTSTTGVNNFTIHRDNTLIGSTGAVAFADNSVVCNTPYNYQLFTNYANGSQSISLQKTETAFSTNTPTSINQVTAVVSGEQVELTWLQDPAFQPVEYDVLRRSGNGPFSLLTTTPTLNIIDDTYTTDAAYCYQINYTDVCDNASPAGIEVCPIRLTGVVNKDNSFTLTWSAYTGWINGVNYYQIEKYDLQGSLVQTFTTTDTFFQDNANDPGNQLFRYVVKAIATDPILGEAVSNEIQLLKTLNLYYPKAFTPNNDNLNDIFAVFGQKEYMARFELKIFNRWGELMYTTDSIEKGWDGKFKGVLQPEGTYAFVAKITDLAGRTFDRSGSFVLLRK